MKFRTTKTIDLDKFFNVEFNKKYPIISCASAMLGIIGGVILQSVEKTVGDGSAGIFNEFYMQNATRSVPGIFLSSFAENMLIIAFLMFLGFSSVGFAAVYIAPIFKGLGVGAVCSYIYSSYLFKGVAYCALAVFPAAALQFVAIILACNESAQMSRDILRLIRKNGAAETKIRTDLYLLRYAVITSVTALSSILYSVGVGLFFKLA